MKMKKGILILITVLSVLTSCEKERLNSDSFNAPGSQDNTNKIVGEWIGTFNNSEIVSESYTFNFYDNGVYEIIDTTDIYNPYYIYSWSVNNNNQLVLDNGHNVMTTVVDQPNFKHYYWETYGTVHYHLKLVRKN